MKIVKKSNENCHFYSREKSLYIAWACFRNVLTLVVPVPDHFLTFDYSFRISE